MLHTNQGAYLLQKYCLQVHLHYRSGQTESMYIVFTFKMHNPEHSSYMLYNYRTSAALTSQALEICLKLHEVTSAWQVLAILLLRLGGQS